MNAQAVARAWSWFRANPLLLWSVAAGLFARILYWAVTDRRLDDALITMKHAKNVADGVGLTHHLGEGGPVHGFTSVLSVLVPLPGELVADGGGFVLIRVVSLVAFVAAAIYAYRICTRTRSRHLANSARLGLPGPRSEPDLLRRRRDGDADRHGDHPRRRLVRPRGRHGQGWGGARPGGALTARLRAVGGAGPALSARPRPPLGGAGARDLGARGLALGDLRDALLRLAGTEHDHRQVTGVPDQLPRHQRHRRLDRLRVDLAQGASERLDDARTVRRAQLRLRHAVYPSSCSRRSAGRSAGSRSSARSPAGVAGRRCDPRLSSSWRGSPTGSCSLRLATSSGTASR